MEFIHLRRRSFPTPFLFTNCAEPSRVSHEMHNCAKNSTVGYFDGTNPITGKDIQLRSPTPIMAPGVYHNVTSVKVLLFLQVRLEMSIACIYVVREIVTKTSFSNCLAAATLPRSLFLPYSDSLASRRNEHCLTKTFVITQRIVLTLFVRTGVFLTKFYGTSVAASINSVMIN